MRRILDKLFENKKLAMLIPIITAAVVYLLFVLFGTGDDKVNVIITTPIVCVFWFFGVFLITFFQVKNPMCPEKFLDFFELMATVVFVSCALVNMITFFINGFQDLGVICPGAVTYSAVAWAHSKREKQQIKNNDKK